MSLSFADLITQENIDLNNVLEYYSKMKKLNTRHGATKEKKRQIVQAALACFTEKGYSETRIADICTRCNANTGSIYHHFKSKELLAAQVYLEGIRDYQAGFLGVLEGQEEAREGIFSLVRYHLEWVEKNPHWARFLIQKRHAEFMGAAADRFNELNRAFMEGCADWFGPHISAGRLRALPREVFVSVLLGPCQEYSRLMVSGVVGTLDQEDIEALGLAAWKALRN